MGEIFIKLSPRCLISVFAVVRNQYHPSGDMFN